MSDRVYNSSGYTQGNTRQHWGIVANRETPCTGVLSLNSAPDWLFDEQCNGIDLGYEDAHADWEAAHRDECEDIAAGEECSCESPDFGPDCSGPRLIGAWKQDSQGRWEPDELDPAHNGYAAIIRESVVQVVWSKHTTRARMCSPCYPGQADLDSPDDNGELCYSLPAE